MCMYNASFNECGNKGNRFSTAIQEVACYVFIRGGRVLYDFFSQNFNWPSKGTIMRQIPRFHPNLIEGRLYIDEFLLFLNKFNYPLQCAVLEDGTAITNVIEVDRQTDLLVGLVSPINPMTGLIHPFTFKSTSAKEIYDSIKKNYSATYVYVILAKPLQKGKLANKILNHILFLIYFIN